MVSIVLGMATIAAVMLVTC